MEPENALNEEALNETNDTLETVSEDANDAAENAAEEDAAEDSDAE